MVRRQVAAVPLEEGSLLRTQRGSPATYDVNGALGRLALIGGAVADPVGPGGLMAGAGLVVHGVDCPPFETDERPFQSGECRTVAREDHRDEARSGC